MCKRRIQLCFRMFFLCCFLWVLFWLGACGGFKITSSAEKKPTSGVDGHVSAERTFTTENEKTVEEERARASCDGGGCPEESRCPSGEAMCGGSCTELLENTEHCGDCHRRCAKGQQCKNGRCVTLCQQGQQICQKKCVNLKRDMANCGACGNICKNGESCTEGRCQFVCHNKLTACSSKCVDISKDVRHCGGCGNACGKGTTCKEGQCIPACQASEKVCDGKCVSLQTNKSHCGVCGNACKSGEICVNGLCGGGCRAHETLCAGTCVDLKANSRHCGRCSRVCKATEACFTGVCIRETWRWIRTMGTQYSDYLKGMTMDGQKNLYLSFKTGSSDPTHTTLDGSKLKIAKSYAHIAKLSPSGQFVWVYSLPFSYSSLFPVQIVWDNHKHLYVAVETLAPISMGGTKLEAGFFLVKLDLNGKLVWAKQMTEKGNSGALAVYRMRADKVGNIYIGGGLKKKTTILSSKASYSPTGVESTFVVKVSPSGALLSVFSSGYTGLDSLSNMQLDTQGNVYVLGYFSGSGSMQGKAIRSTGSNDIYIAKFSTTGRLLWVATGGSTKWDFAGGLAVDALAQVYVTGFVRGQAAFGRHKPKYLGKDDVFILKISSSGQFLWVQSGGSSSFDGGATVTVQDKDRLVVTGTFSGTAIFGPWALSSPSGGRSFFMAFVSTKTGQYNQMLKGGLKQYTAFALLASPNEIYLGGEYRRAAGLGRFKIAPRNGTTSRDIYIAKVQLKY